MYKVLGHSQCGFCKQAITFLASKGESFVYLDARKDSNKDLVTQLKAEGKTTVPQIWFDDEYIGGFDKLKGEQKWT